MKTPSFEILFYTAIFLGGAVYFIVKLPTTAAEYQAVAVILSVCMVIAAVLLLMRFRWSPELYILIMLFVLGWGVVQGLMTGFDRPQIGMIVGGIVALFGYPVLRGEVRGKATPKH